MTRVDGDIWITISYLRRHLHRVLDEVEAGHTFAITRYGRAVARLLPVKG